MNKQISLIHQFIIALLVFAACTRIPAHTVLAQQQGNCFPGSPKIENSPFTYTDPNGDLINSVFVKAGSNTSTNGMACTEITQNGDNGCYTVAGLGTTTVTVTKSGSGADCKDISHVEFMVGVYLPTPTPDDTLNPTPTPADWIILTPTPTDAQEASPTPTETIIDPTATPAPTQAQNNSNPSPTPTNATAIGGTDVNTPSSNTSLGSSSDSSTNNASSQGEVLGATTELAGTGNAFQDFVTMIGMFGLALTTAGVTRHAKHD